ncbi:kinase-like protein [Auricularia subglabra TFB-10046 SS5]|nr:kinase-like protein [Auricularia subglabra TFB-10046 SS5]
MKEFIAKRPRTNRLRLVKQVADAVRYLHVTAGIVHGDLKCGNVLISDSEDALLADFGLSTLIEPSETPTATFIRICSTAPFAAPELFEDQAFNDADATESTTPRSKTPFSDSYAFASLVYETYAGEAPWHGATVPVVIRHACKSDTPPRTVENPLYLPFDDRLWQLCLDCWRRNAFARPSFTAIYDTLNGLDA